MTRGLVRALLALGLAAAAAAAAAAAPAPAPAGDDGDMYGGGWAETRIAFGSCSKQGRPQPLWAPIVAGRPHAFLWLGDVVYADKSLPGLGFVRWSGTVEGARADFEQQRARPEYAPLLELQRRGMLLDGARDDHDSITNDANRHSPHLFEAQQLFLDFLGVPEHSPRRARRGLYSAHTVGPPGRRVKAVLLDVRGHQDEMGAKGADILGAEQWEFLERELVLENDAQLTLVGSGVQVASNNKAIAEGWKQFPEARRRLYALLQRAAAARPGTAALLLSGDVHMAEITRSHACAAPGSAGDDGSALPVYDVTSSGMTHAWGEHRTLPRWLVDRLYRTAMDQSHLVGGGFFLGLNYATVAVEWEPAGGGSPVVRVNVRDRRGDSRLELVRTIEELRARVARPDAAAREDCAVVHRLEYGTGGLYVRGVQLGLVLWLLTSVLLPLLVLCALRRCVAGRGREKQE